MSFKVDGFAKSDIAGDEEGAKEPRLYDMMERKSEYSRLNTRRREVEWE
jgi:hypothetical protein